MVIRFEQLDDLKRDMKKLICVLEEANKTFGGLNELNHTLKEFNATLREASKSMSEMARVIKELTRKGIKM